MLVEEESNSVIIRVLDKMILFSIFIFALASLTSKGASSVGIGLACLAWLIRIVVTKDYNFSKTKLDKVIIFFITALLFSGLDVSKVKFFDEVDSILLAILFYYVIINTIDSLDIVKKLSYTVFFSMLISLGYGFYQKFSLGMHRIEGFSFSLSYGLLLSIFLLFTLSYLLWARIDIKKRLILFISSIGAGMNLLYTLSRGAWLGFIGGLASIVFLKDKRLIGALVIGFILLGVFLPATFINRFKSISDLRTGRSIITRLNLWQGSWQMFLDHPINGVGLGYFTREFDNNYRSSFDILANTTHAHNNFFHLLATTGLLGLLSFSWLILRILYLLFNNYHSFKVKQWRLFLLASLGGVVSFTIQGLTEYSLGDAEPLRFFWFLIALCMIIINRKDVLNLA